MIDSVKHHIYGIHMTILFRAAKQNRIFQDVVGQIQDAIINGKIGVGDRLPPERELKTMLQTSRSTIREALRVLEQKGLIEIKLGTGGGAVVRKVTPDQVTESLDLMIKSQKVSLTHMAEFRERVEGDVVELAAKNASEEDIRLLRRKLSHAREYVDMGSEFVTKFWEADKDVHLSITDITRNPIYISVCKTIHNNIIHYLEKFLPREKEIMEENYNDLSEIVEAVAQGRAEAAKNLAQDHVNRFNRYMERVQSGKMTVSH